MKFAVVAILLICCHSTLAMPFGSSSETGKGNQKGDKQVFYHPVDHLDVKHREHLNFDPCQLKRCPTGQECHAVRNPYLLQIPIAICRDTEPPTPEEDKNGDCSNFHLGTTIFKCRTKDDWRKAAERQCSLRLATPTEILFVEVRYACHGSSGSSSVFMQATVSCCGKGKDIGKATKDPPTTPPLTTAPTTSPTRPSSATRTKPTMPPVPETKSPRTKPSEVRTRPTRPFPTTDVPPSMRPATRPLGTSTLPTEETFPSEYFDDDSDGKEIRYPDNSVNIDSAIHAIHHHALWIVLPIVALLTLCAMICIVLCVARSCLARRRQRNALKRFPPPDLPHETVNHSFDTSDGEEEIYTMKNPAVVFDSSPGDQLAYDMYIAVKK